MKTFQHKKEMTCRGLSTNLRKGRGEEMPAPHSQDGIHGAKAALKLHAEVVAVQVNQQQHEQGEINEKPHHKAAFFTFIFNMI
jgi:hypothetical protein